MKASDLSEPVMRVRRSQLGNGASVVGVDLASPVLNELAHGEGLFTATQVQEMLGTQRERCARLVEASNVYRGGHGEPPRLTAGELAALIRSGEEVPDA